MDGIGQPGRVSDLKYKGIKLSQWLRALAVLTKAGVWPQHPNDSTSPSIHRHSLVHINAFIQNTHTNAITSFKFKFKCNILMWAQSRDSVLCCGLSW